MEDVPMDRDGCANVEVQYSVGSSSRNGTDKHSV